MIPFQFGGQEYPTKAYVVQDLEEQALLGADFLNEYQAALDFQSRTVRYRNSIVPVFDPRKPKQAVTADHQTIPARSVKTVQIVTPASNVWMSA